MKNWEASNAVITHAGYCEDLLAKIAEEIKERKADARTGHVNWGHAGDVGFVRTKLHEIAKQLGCRPTKNEGASQPQVETEFMAEKVVLAFAVRFLLSNLDEDVVGALNESTGLKSASDVWERFVSAMVTRLD